MSGKSGGGSGLKVTFKNIAKNIGYGGLKPVQASAGAGWREGYTYCTKFSTGPPTRGPAHQPGVAHDKLISYLSREVLRYAGFLFSAF